MVNTQKTRDGEIVSISVLRALLETGQWEVTRTSQVIDGESYWRAENDAAMDYCLVSISDCGDEGITAK